MIPGVLHNSVRFAPPQPWDRLGLHFRQALQLKRCCHLLAGQVSRLDASDGRSQAVQEGESQNAVQAVQSSQMPSHDKPLLLCCPFPGPHPS